MAETTGISWAHSTFNGWVGCTKVSAGCANCYAERDMDKRRHFAKWGPGQERRRTGVSYWRQPLAWDRKAQESGAPWRVFSASLSDWLDHEAPVQWLCELLTVIAATPHLTWMLLTKRIASWEERLQAAVRVNPYTEHVGWCHDVTSTTGDMLASAWLDGEAPANVWLGTSVEDQEAADKRIPAILDIPARTRFLSCEPLIGPVDLGDWLLEEDGPHDDPAIGWVIAGGESGPATRPMDLAWARGLRDQTREAGGAFFVKQLGGHPDPMHDIDTFPEDLRIREFPDARAVRS